MDIEKSLVVAAPIDRVWTLLLDPKVMAGCVPGVQSVGVLSDKEYLAQIKVKISFIAATFRIRTTILETRPPHYLRCEGAGEDASVASSLKQTTEMFLAEAPGGTEIRIKTHAEVFGRLGSFGLSVMKTKADRMWEEFGANLAAVLRQDGLHSTTDANQPAAKATAKFSSGRETASQAKSLEITSSSEVKPIRRHWWKRLLGPGQESDNLREMRLPSDIYLEMHRGGDVVKVLWPGHDAENAIRLLNDVLRD